MKLFWNTKRADDIRPYETDLINENGWFQKNQSLDILEKRTADVIYPYTKTCYNVID